MVIFQFANCKRSPEGTWLSAKISQAVWVCLKMLCTPENPMVLLIIIPILNRYFIGGRPHFQTYPCGFNVEFFVLFDCLMTFYDVLRRFMVLFSWSKWCHMLAVSYGPQWNKYHWDNNWYTYIYIMHIIPATVSWNMASWKTHQLNVHINGKFIELKGSFSACHVWLREGKPWLEARNTEKWAINPIAIVSGRSNEEQSRNGRAWRLTHL